MEHTAACGFVAVHAPGVCTEYILNFEHCYKA